MTYEDVDEFVEALVAGRSQEEQIKVLKDCLKVHCLEHPWVDEECRDTIMDNIAREYNIPYTNIDGDDFDEDDEG